VCHGGFRHSLPVGQATRYGPGFNASAGIIIDRMRRLPHTQVQRQLEGGRLFYFEIVQIACWLRPTRANEPDDDFGVYQSSWASNPWPEESQL
jgi:hypothetical protein